MEKMLLTPSISVRVVDGETLQPIKGVKLMRIPDRPIEVQFNCEKTKEEEEYGTVIATTNFDGRATISVVEKGNNDEV